MKDTLVCMLTWIEALVTIEDCECLPREDSGYVDNLFNKDKDRKGKYHVLMNHLAGVPPPCTNEEKFRVVDTLQTAYTGKTSVSHTVYDCSLHSFSKLCFFM